MIHKGLTQELGNWRNTMFFKVKDGNPTGCCFRIHEYPNESGYYISCNDWDITEQIEVYVKQHRKYKMFPTVFETDEQDIIFELAQGFAKEVNYLPFVGKI